MKNKPEDFKNEIFIAISWGTGAFAVLGISLLIFVEPMRFFEHYVFTFACLFLSSYLIIKLLKRDLIKGVKDKMKKQDYKEIRKKAKKNKWSFWNYLTIVVGILVISEGYQSIKGFNINSFLLGLFLVFLFLGINDWNYDKRILKSPSFTPKTKQINKEKLNK